MAANIPSSPKSTSEDLPKQISLISYFLVSVGFIFGFVQLINGNVYNNQTCHNLMVVSCFIFHIALLVGIFQKNQVLVILHGWFVFVASVFYTAQIIVDSAEMIAKNPNNFEITRIILCLVVVCLCFGFMNWLAIWVICGVKRHNHLEKLRRLSELGNASSTRKLNCCWTCTSYLCLCKCFSCIYIDRATYENNSPTAPDAKKNADPIASTSGTSNTKIVPASEIKDKDIITSVNYNKSENDESVNLLK